MTMICATLYYDTEQRKYLNLNWANATPSVAKPSEDSPTFRELTGVWSEILAYLGQEVINMRKVCSFFLKPEFRPLYERSPIYLDSSCDKGEFLEQYLASHCLITNSVIHKEPNYQDCEQSCFNVEDYQKIVRHMPNLQSLSTLLVRGDYEIASLKNGASHPSKVTEIVFRSPIWLSWDDLLDPNIFPQLEKMRVYNSHLLGGTENLRKASMPSLRSLFIHFRNYSDSLDINIGMALDDLSRILETVPNLEELKIAGNKDQEEGPVSLAPESLSKLQKLTLIDPTMSDKDIMELLSAAPFIRHLEIGSSNGVKSIVPGSFSSLRVNDLPNLRVVEFGRMNISQGDFNALLNAAPQLSELIMYKQAPLLHSSPTTAVDVLQKDYPSIKKIAIQSRMAYGGIGDVDVMLPYLERMSGLEVLTFSFCLVGDKRVDQTMPEAFAQLKRLRVVKSQVSGSYLTDMLNKAKSLESIEWEDSASDWMFQKLDENALRHLTNLSFKNISASCNELYSLFSKAIHLQKLEFDGFGLQETKEVNFTLSPHSLPELIELKNGGLTKDQFFEMIKAASNVEKLEVHPLFWESVPELPDGYLSRLRDVSNHSIFTETQRTELLRIAPNLQILRPEGHPELVSGSVCNDGEMLK